MIISFRICVRPDVKSCRFYGQKYAKEFAKYRTILKKHLIAVHEFPEFKAASAMVNLNLNEKRKRSGHLNHDNMQERYIRIYIVK